MGKMDSTSGEVVFAVDIIPGAEGGAGGSPSSIIPSISRPTTVKTATSSGC